ncbi:DUF1501 domain-containing protein [Arcticibacterium luteifluviistationis]|uniref:Sulfatase n=1 Tax=Arcticibacterium luteifluviistationis TaxID=1784714 RepID=A0A2Z4GHW7_9BACT|nr:DUF1501 domain-containing protein [Arcticibacterium luteifluviistationis]AWW00658.1 sulfatase [Arcticibacterium luteifluviistationis]
MDKDFIDNRMNVNRRHFLGKAAAGIGGIALGSLLMPDLFKGGKGLTEGLPVGIPHFAPKAKRVIYLFQNGAPSQLESFDYKPKLNTMAGQDLPESIRKGQRLTGMTAGQSKFPLVGSYYDFKQYGKSGAWISDLFPNIAKIADDICIVRSMNTEAINHDPALTFMQTGSQIGNRPSMGAWMSYGLGSENQNLPAFTVLLSRGRGNGQGVYSKLWSNGFLDSTHQGVLFSSGEDPILYLNDPDAMSRASRRKMLDKLAELNHMGFDKNGDPEVQAKVQQYEMAYRMQTAVPELTDLSKESDATIKMYGPECLVPGTYAANALLARKLSESGVRFVQLYHQGWDQHGNLPNEMALQAEEVDRASAALVTDLKQRGMLDETLVIWGGEFGRTNYCQGGFTEDNYGRDHHPRAYSIWMAGGGIKPGMVYGETDELGYNIIKDPVHVNDFHATVLNQMGLDHEQLTYKHLGRRYRLTDVAGKVINDIIS